MGRLSKQIGVVQAIWPPVLLAIVGFPLALELVAPNPFYGVRTTETLESLDAWYRANLLAGWVAVLSGSVATIANLVIVRSPHIQAHKKWWFTLGTTLLAVGATVAAGLLAS